MFNIIKSEQIFNNKNNELSNFTADSTKLVAT